MNLSLEQLRLGDGLTAVAMDVQGIAGVTDASLLKKTLTQVLQQGYRTIVVNMARLRDLDTRCWESFVSVARRLHRLGGRLVLLNCPDDQYNFLVARRWEKCFLLPRRRREDADSLPAELRPWIADRIVAASGQSADVKDHPHRLTLDAGDALVRHAFLRNIGRRFGHGARLVLQEFVANAAEHCPDHHVDILVQPDRLVAFDHGGGLTSEATDKPDGLGGYGLRLIRAFGGTVTAWREGLRLEYPLPAKADTVPHERRPNG